MSWYRIITFGCQMNESNSERIAKILEKKGYKPIKDDSSADSASVAEPTSAKEAALAKADLILVNMCSVRQSAVDRVFGFGQKLKKLKALNPKLKTVLTGCILKQDKGKFREKFDEIWEMKNYCKISPKCQNHFQALIPISNGCNNFCSYCVVPYARGPLICRPHKEILKEVKDAVKKGAREIWLLGQNVNDYNFPTEQKINFAKLLEMANDIPGNFQIRFMSPHPADFTDELIDVMTKSKKVAKYLNLPVQSGDNKILKRMNRPYTVEQYKNLVKKIRKKIPDINLTTDVIVGFPGETQSQFKNTVKLFKKIKFNLAYISKYSPRPGTAAFKIKDNVPLKEKKKREKILRELLKK